MSARLLAQEALINLIVEHQYVPHKSRADFMEIVEALKEIQPGTNYCLDCSGAIIEIGNRAKVLLEAYKITQKLEQDEAMEHVKNMMLPPDEPKFMTFPVHEKPVEVIEVQVDRPDKRPRKPMSDEHKQAIKDAHARRKK